jgi:molybdopterin-dependent oxidoreductase alpha subunit
MEKREFVEGAETPEEFTGLKTTEIKKYAAGLPAVLSSAKMVFSEAGVLRGMKALNLLNQKNGFDCPSCAWPDPDDERSRLGEYCENGARAVAEEATAKRLMADFFAQNAVADLAKLNDYEIGKKGRIAEPVYLPKGATHYQPISWDEAFAKIGTALNKLASPNEAIFYTSGRTSNEAAFLYQLFIREYGTNNLPDCSNMCHESSGSALGESLGLGKGSVTLNDFYDAEVIVILGQNPGTNHPRMMSALEKAKKKGAVIISVNPIPEPGLIAFANPQEVKGMLGMSSPLSDYYYQVRINGDMALLQAVTQLLIAEDEKHPGSVFDHAFIQEKTLGYEELIAHIKSLDFDVLVKDSGITEAEVRQLAEVLKNKNRIIACWAMGLTQHKNAVDTIKEIVNLLLLNGSIGKKGAGTCPVRGHSNVQGDRTMGIYEKPPKSLLDSIERNFHFKPPQEHGYDVVAAIKAMYEKRASVFFAMGGNFLSATPDTNYTAKALQNCSLTVHVSTKLNRSHLIHGEEALILPCYGRTDIDTTGGNEAQFVTCENSMGVVQMSKGMLQPVSDQLLSEPEIVVRLAKATLGERSKVNWSKYLEHYDVIREDIEKTIAGFDKYNLRVRVPGGFYLPNPPREGSFATPSKKAHFNVGHIHVPQLKDDELMMMTIRTHDQFNTTVYGLNDRYRGIYNERRVILMNEKDIVRLGFKDRDVVDLYNRHGGVERVVRKFIIIKYPIAERCAATYFPETNVLVPIDSVADKSHTPTSKMVILSLRKSE